MEEIVAQSNVKGCRKERAEARENTHAWIIAGRSEAPIFTGEDPKVMKRYLAIALVAAMALAVALGVAACGKPKKLVIGFVPSRDVEKLKANIEPLIAALEKELGMEVEGYVGTNFSAVIENMGSKNNPTDVGLLNPFGYVLANRSNGAEVILKSLRGGKDYYRAQFFVHVDSGYKSLDDLKAAKEAGKKLKWAIPDDASTSGYLFPATALLKMGFNLETDIEKVPAGNHDNTVLAVYNKEADFGTGFEDNRVNPAKEKPDIMDKVVVIGYSDNIPNDTVTVRKGLDPQLKQKIKDAFKAIASTEEGKEIIKNVYSWDGVADATDSDFDIVRTVLDELGYEPK